MKRHFLGHYQDNPFKCRGANDFSQKKRKDFDKKEERFSDAEN